VDKMTNGNWMVVATSEETTIIKHKETGEEKSYRHDDVTSKELNEILTLVLGEKHGIEVK
jgi:hypothetical protein